jgi:CSLREA domain-containing protein
MNSSMRHVAVGIRGPGVVVWLTATLLVLAALAWGLPARAAQTLAVTSTVDDTNPANYACPATITKPCTLRLAIETANGETGDTISVPAGTYTLTTDTELYIGTAMNIVGADPRTTIIDGDNGGNRIFSIGAGFTPIDVGISNLTLQNAFHNGSYGGAMFNGSTGTVTLDNDAIVSNQAQSAGASWGGGIYSGDANGATHLKITRSLIAGNTVMQGTDTSNPSLGGGIYIGRPIDVLSITNSTMTANSATGGGAIFNFGTATLVNDTIAGNFGGLDPTGAPGGGGLTDELPTSYTLTNTIVSGNTHGDCRKWLDNGTFNSAGHNIDGDGTCFLTDPTDKPSTDPHLAALALNSPGQTKTMAIGATSAAYNAAGAAACPATDQRGVSRPQGSACDIGAYELVVLAASPTPAASPSPSPTPAASPSPSPIPALPKAGSAGSPGAGSQVGLLLGVTALLLAPLAVALARRRHPDDNPVA